MDISDALSEKDRVKFTVHTVTTMAGFAKTDFCVVRQHEEFVWLHDRIEENDDYGGYIVSNQLALPPPTYYSHNFKYNFFCPDSSVSTAARL